MRSGEDIIKQVTTKWRLVRVTNALLVVMGLCFLISNLTNELWLLLALGVVAVLMSLFLFRPWAIDHRDSANWIDKMLDSTQNSTYLLISEATSMTDLALVQRQRVSNFLVSNQKRIPWPQSVKAGAIACVLLVGAGFIVRLIPPAKSNNVTQKEVSFIPVSDVNKERPLELTEASVLIDYPNYTRKKTVSTSELNIEALEGAIITWELLFNGVPMQLYLEMHNGKRLSFKKSPDKFNLSTELLENGFYKFIYTDSSDQEFQSDLYQLAVLIDEPPVLEITGLDRFTLLEIDADKNVQFTSSLKDDFGISETAIIATVSKGSGESVKFREQRMTFDQSLKPNAKSARLSKTINLNDLKMTPGDELYFYIEAFDNKQPVKNRSRTETYFVSIRDTTKIEFSLEGALGVDLMPEYFRSQRQIIIDTERLIKEKSQIPKDTFNFRSNELGFDQKSLRLKYGQFMGEEFETGIAETGEAEEDHDHEEEADPLAEYTHDHDGDNEHNLVEGEEEDPLEEYSHIHDDPEEATLYTASIKGKLRAAMTEMWDAELNLRLYEPHKSLPYQYRALKLIKEIKNHARIYVHRIGFDPPPIKEDKRLSGDIEQVETLSQSNDKEPQKTYPNILTAIKSIDDYFVEGILIDNTIFKNAGDELAAIAIDNPGKHFKTLQTLQRLYLNEVVEEQFDETLQLVQYQLHRALPAKADIATSASGASDQLTEAFEKELNHLNQ